MSELDTSIAAEVTIGDDADVADNRDLTYLIPNEKSELLILIWKSNSSSTYHKSISNTT